MRLRPFVLSILILTLLAWSASGQVTGSISGVVTDASGAVVPGADVTVTSIETGRVLSLKTNEVGIYRAGTLASGFYRVEVNAKGFRQFVVNQVKVDVGTPVTVDVTLEVGATTESVQIQADVTAIQTANAAVATTVVGQQITQLPFTSRDALDLALLMPGFSTGGSPRAGSFNALPKGSINITMDGVNTQDNLLKSAYGGGFFTYVRPRIDAIEEVSVQTAVPGSESAGEGAVQIRFVTRRGTNEWHGGVYWYHRNTALNSNYWFNNLNGLPRSRIILNQWGGKMGGPIIKNKLFIFGNFEEFKLPEQQLRSRTVFKTEAIEGNFRYVGTDGQTRVVNVLDIARNNGFPSTPNAMIRDLLQAIDKARGLGVGITPLDQFRDTMSFNNSGNQTRRFPVGRLDWNVTDKLAWEAVWNYNYFSSFPDMLNGYDRLYPGMETWNGHPTEGGQYSSRFAVSTAVKYTASPTVNNEFRIGWQGGTASFAPEWTPGTPLQPGGYRFSIPLISGVPTNLGLRSDRNTPVFQFNDNLGWQKKSHTLNFGVQFTRVTTWAKGYGNTVPTISLGVTAGDPARAIFNSTTLPAISANDEGTAASLWAALVGRISGVTGVINVDENEKKYVYGAPLIQRERQTEYGIYFSDTWRMRPGLTLNYGLRWGFQGVPLDSNGIYTSPGYDGVWGRSGAGNLFAPGVLTGRPTEYNPRTGTAYNNDWNNWSPSFGLAWSPRRDGGLLRWIFGREGAWRMGYGVAYNREGLQNFRSYAAGNPGTRASGNLVADRDFKAGSLMLGGAIPSIPYFPSAYQFPLKQDVFRFTSTGPLWFDPNIRVPYVQSWNAGIQRDLPAQMVLEVRYVGNKATHLWRGVNIQEVNIFENGFLQQFIAAQRNLSICEANRAACTGSATGTLRFDNRGLAGQADLPLFAAAFQGVALASGFGNATILNNLRLGAAGSVANTLATNATYMGNIERAGYPANLFQVNPDAAGASAWLLKSPSNSTYHSLQIEVRRRMSRGLLVSGNYVFSKGLTDYWADSSDSSTSWRTLRNFSLNKGVSPYDIRHQFKINWLYELPFGYGRTWTPGNRVLNHIAGGWEWDGIARIQSGRPFRLDGGYNTVNQIYASGIYSTLTRQELQSKVGVYKMPDKRVFYIDPNLVGSDGRAKPEILIPASTPGVWGNFIDLYGPRFIRFDMSAVKRTRIGEKWNVELRAQFLNAFNNANFLVGGATGTAIGDGTLSTTFGRTGEAYRDVSTTNDPGGRIVELVLRINF